MSIADKITQLTTIRASMREKLVAKGVDASTHNFADFPNDVESIPSGGEEEKSYYPDRIFLSHGYGVEYYTYNARFRLLNKDGSYFVYNLASANNSARLIFKFNVTDNSTFNNWCGGFGDDRTSEPATKSIGGYFFPNNRFAIRLAQGDNTPIEIMVDSISLNTWYYLVAKVDITNSTYSVFLYDDNGTLISQNSTSFSTPYNNTSGWTRLCGINNNSQMVGAVSLTDTCYLIDETEVWGKLNSKTQNMGLEE